MASVTGLLEERETVARVRVEELRVEADRILAELGEAEDVLERRVIACAELTEALAAPALAEDVLAPGPQDSHAVSVAGGPGSGAECGSHRLAVGEGRCLGAHSLPRL